MSMPAIEPDIVALGLCGIGGCAFLPHAPGTPHTWERPAR